MQNNVIELTQRLLRSLDDNYNVVDMPAVIEIISILEKVSITKELLETTRLGKYINELRKKTSNESLSKRAKELVKKWKNMVLPDTNGQVKPAYPAGQISERTDLDKGRKRPAREAPEHISQMKRPKINGQSTDFDFSDNSNSSFKDVNKLNELRANSTVIMINSDSNSSLPDALRQDPPLEQQLPKKRGRKKGSKNHRNLLDDAESSLANKLAVSSLCMSRGNSKVKTTQELIAGLQNKGTSSVLGLPPLNSRPKEDLNERAAKLTERVSMIDQRLYTNSNRSKQKNRFTAKLNVEKNDRVIESGSVINDKSLATTKVKEEEEIIVVDDVVPSDKKEESEPARDVPQEPEGPPPLTVDEILAQLPPVDLSFLQEPEPEEPSCTCVLRENKTDFSVEEAPAETEPEPPCQFEFVEDETCPAKTHYEEKYRLNDVDECRVQQLGQTYLPNVNGNPLTVPNEEVVEKDDRGLYVNVVPNVYSECKLKGELPKENYKKYSISEAGEAPADERTGDSEFCGFAEWHECIERPSYNGDTLKILPYVVID
ncbi:uncharacterized protein LOC123320711 [Coccinella septempunctata]|uniref:uncharacterized protein LOC123320711 n=1 Tax=Coccinella septempunctata TaxID=41139 RepID=UPI001D07E29F|nr:uncharacterized protein LOC123320711 [Coccinella septempunctata]